MLSNTQLGSFTNFKTRKMSMRLPNSQSFLDFKDTQLGNSLNSGFLDEPRCIKQVISCLAPLKTLTCTVLDGPRWSKDSKQSLSCSRPLKFKNYSNQEVGLFRTVERNKNLLSVRVKSVMDVSKVVEKDEVVEGRNKGGYDAIVIGSGIGGLVAATQLAVKGAKVLVLEKYVIPGGSSGFYERDGYTFDVGSSVMFGFSDKVLGYFVFCLIRLSDDLLVLSRFTYVVNC
ncbi:putative prolycopene isomerase [Helianthus annuus]|nr:putative prolycopene isomerase [Helianthus annuus]